MEKLGVADVARIAKKSARHIRNMCQEGKLPCLKQKISTGVKYLIYTDTEEFKTLMGGDFSIESLEEVPLYEGSFADTEEGSEEGNNPALKEIVAELTGKIIDLAKEAGRAELLTSTIIEKQNDVKYYQDEYFKVSHDLTAARMEIDSLKNENFELKQQINKLETQLNERSKSLWSKILNQ